MEVAGRVEEAVTANVADAEITGLEALDDGTVSVTLTVDMGSDQETHKDADMGDEDVTENDKNPEGGEADTTPDNDCADETDGPTDMGDGSWKVNGEILERNDLQKAVSAADVPWPSDTSSENLAEVLFNAATPSNTDDSGGQDEQVEDTTNESDTNDENDGVSDQFLLNNGVAKENISAARKHRQDHGVCQAENCEHGSKSDSNDYCASHDNGKNKGNSSGSSGQSNADKTERVMNIFGCTNSVAQTAIRQVEDDMFGSVKEAIEAQS